MAANALAWSRVLPGVALLWLRLAWLLLIKSSDLAGRTGQRPRKQGDRGRLISRAMLAGLRLCLVVRFRLGGGCVVGAAYRRGGWAAVERLCRLQEVG